MTTAPAAPAPTILGFDQATILGYLRHIIGAGGGALVAHGFVTTTQLTEITNDLAGIALIAIVSLWSAYQKRQQKVEVAVAKATPVPLSTTTGVAP